MLSILPKFGLRKGFSSKPQAEGCGINVFGALNFGSKSGKGRML
jgi:hypothetical protein